MQTYSVYIKGILVTNDEDPNEWDARVLKAAIEHVEVIGIAPHTVNLERAPKMLKAKIDELETKPVKKKRKYRCAACGQLGHPVSRCPNKDTLTDLPKLGDKNE